VISRDVRTLRTQEDLYPLDLTFGGCVSIRSHVTIAKVTQRKENLMSTERAPIKVLLRGEESGGVVSVIESGSLPGFAGPPLHYHAFDETFYVIEGELTFQLGDELFTRKAGEVAFAPRGVAHTYANLSDAPTRHLIACTPAGFERYFARMAAERRGEEAPEWALQPIPGSTTVGPRIGERDPGERPSNRRGQST
jgi:quercetin dioxygenase-like cupin family protein